MAIMITNASIMDGAMLMVAANKLMPATANARAPDGPRNRWH